MDNEKEKFESFNIPTSVLRKLEEGKMAVDEISTVIWKVNEDRRFWGIKSARVAVEKVVVKYDVWYVEGYVEHRIEEITAVIEVIGDNIFPLYPRKVIVRSTGNVSDVTVDFGGKKK